MTDYSLWEVILNGDSLVPTRIIKGVLQPVAPTTAEQRLACKNELKARGTLLMALPDKHQLKFNSHKDAKTLMEAIEKRFGGNTKTKKVQRTILKQQFENFTGSIFEGLDQIHDRLQKLVSQLKIHGVSVSQKDVNLKFLRNLPSEWKTHTLIWRNKSDLEEQSLDDLFNNLKLYETEVKQSSSTSTATQNLAFVSSSHTDSNTDSVSAAASGSAAYAKLPASPLPNVDSLSNAINVDDIEEIDLRWQMAMLTMRARRFLQKTGRNLGANGPTSMGFDMSKVECYNCYKKGHFARECRSPKDPRRPGVAEPQKRTVPTGLESVKARLLVYKQNESVFEENIKLLNIEVQLRDTALATLRQKLDKAEKDSDDLKLKLEKFQTSSKNLIELLASQTSEKTGLGYNSQVFTKAMFDCDNYYSLESDCESWPPSSLYDMFQPSGGYHAVPPLYTGTFMPPKPNLVFNTAPTAVETDHLAFDFVLSFAQSSEHVKSPRHSVQPIETTIPAATPAPVSPKSNSSGQRRNRKACFVCKSIDHLIKDCDFHTKQMAQPTQRNYAHRGHHKQYAPLTHSKPQKHVVLTAVLTQSKPVSNTAVRPVSAALPNITVTRPRYAHHVVTKFNSSIRRHITRSLFSKTSNSPPRVTVVQAPVVSVAQGNMSYLSEFEELNRGYVAFGGNPGGKITGKGKIKTDSLLPIPFWAEAVNTACYVQNRVLVTKPHNLTHYELLHGRTPKKAGEEVDQTYMLFPVWSAGSTNPQNNDNDAAFDGKEHDFDAKKPESEVIFLQAVVLNQRNKMTRQRKSNEVNAAGSIVLTVGQNSLNSTNTFSAAGPSNDVVSPTYGKSSFIDAFQLPDDPYMPELEDITYSDDEDVVGAEANFNNLESSIPVSPIPTTRIHKDHPVSQIIGDLSLTTQTRSMTRVVKDQGGLSQMFGFEDPNHPNKVYKVVKALYGLHQAPRAWYETLVTYLLENGFQRGTIDQTLFIKKQKGDILLVKQKKDGIFISQDKYVAEILRKFRLIKGKLASTPIDTEKPLLNDSDGEDVHIHTYRSMIGSLMYLTSSRPDIMFAVCACARFQVTPKALHLHAVKKIFRYLKGKPHLGLWYPKDSPFDLVAYSDSDYAGASLDIISTTGGCQSLRCILISWQCKKQTVVATSSTEAEYVAATSCCTQVLWIQNQLLDYG
nr:hypothetical protein [Tanacetum cinerariifolium]